MNSYAVTLYSDKKNEIKRFLDYFYCDNIILNNELKWEKVYKDPIELLDIVGVFIENSDKYKINMWISIDEGIFININDYNAENIIRYIYERFPY